MNDKIIIATETYITAENKILLFKRSETAKKFPGVYMTPGGHVDEGEDYLTSARREILEETGYTANLKRLKLKACAVHHHIDRKENWIFFIFLLKVKKLFKTISSDEGTPEWVDIKSTMNSELIFSPIKYYLDHVLNKKGILYTNIELESGKIVKILASEVGN